MAGRIRSIKPEVLEDEVACALSNGAWRLWVSSWLLADDHGRFRAGSKYLAANVWQDTSRADEAETALSELQRKRMVYTYTVEGQRYGELKPTGWAKHQNVLHPGKPRVPVPSNSDYIGAVPPKTSENLGESRISSARGTPAIPPTSDLRPPTSDRRSADPHVHTHDATPAPGKPEPVAPAPGPPPAEPTQPAAAAPSPDHAAIELELSKYPMFASLDWRHLSNVGVTIMADGTKLEWILKAIAECHEKNGGQNGTTAREAQKVVVGFMKRAKASNSQSTANGYRHGTPSIQPGNTGIRYTTMKQTKPPSDMPTTTDVAARAAALAGMGAKPPSAVSPSEPPPGADLANGTAGH